MVRARQVETSHAEAEPTLRAATLDDDGQRVTFALADGRVRSVSFDTLGIPVQPRILMVAPDEVGAGLYLLRDDGTLEDCSLALLLEPSPGTGARDLAEGIAQRLVALRAERGWSQRETAKRLGMAASNYARLERARHVPSTQTLARLATCFDVPLSEFVSR